MVPEDIEDPEPQTGTVPAPPMPCPPTSIEDPGGRENAPYRLKGRQVEYEAAFWLLNPQVVTPKIDLILDELEKVGQPAPYPQGRPELVAEIAALQDLAANRRTPYDKIRTVLKPATVALIQPSPLSIFLQLQKHPFGAVFNTGAVFSPRASRPQYRVSNVVTQETRINLKQIVVQTGEELARLFENETPGLYHRHALNWLLFNRSDVSPVRQARIWAALDMTIYAALSAAWYFKWALSKDISFRQRPWEYDHNLEVLYDYQINENGDGNDFLKGMPCPTPGTPRHPAYPSGHSTYSAAASRLLEYFFPDVNTGVNIPVELDNLANNIGQARLWAGVHWESDHSFGRAVGRAVAQVIINQLEKDCVPILPPESRPIPPADRPPTDAELAAARAARTEPCAANHDQIPPRTGDPRERLAF